MTKTLRLLLTLPLFTALCFTSCKKDRIPGQPGAGQNPVDHALVFEVSEQVTTESERVRLQHSWKGSDFLPTGLFLPANGTLKVSVEQVTGTRLPQLLIGTYSRYGKWSSVPAVVNLKAGENSIKDADLKGIGGLIWIRYTNDAASAEAKITFTDGFRKVPYYELGKTTNTAWKQALSSMTNVPDVILASIRGYIVVSRSNAVKYQDENQDNLLNKLDQIINLEAEISGLDGSSDRDKTNIHKFLLTEHEDPDYYFFAYDYRTAYIGNSTNAILTYNSMANDGWGVWHEIGHQHQQVWTWGAIGEVTVNVFSLYVQRTLNPSENRLVKDAVWPKAKSYLALPAKDYNSDQASVWVRLCMFQQLYLAFGNDFFKNLTRKTRLDKPTFTGTDEERNNAKMNYFMRSACQVSGKDLSEFFKKWGLNVNSTVYAEIAALNLPKPVSDLTQLQD